MMEEGFTESSQSPSLDIVLGALQDSDCQRIIRQLEEPRTAKGLSDQCELPMATTYRKLRLLTEASLVKEKEVIKADGHHTTQYHLAFKKVEVGRDSEHRLTLTVHFLSDINDNKLKEVRLSKS